MPISIISKKVIKPLYPRIAMINYTNELSDNAKTFNGFLVSNSYWKFPIDKYDHDLTIISISQWKDIKYWNKWYKSKERDNIYKKNSHIIKSEEFSILVKKIQNDDLFLL